MSNEKTKAMRLADCPPGLFFWNGTLGFKSDYGMMERSIPEGKTWTVGKRPDAYCADTGEIFWGGTQTHEERSEVLVYPVDAAALSPEAPAREGATHPDAQPFERFPELALHIERMAMTGLVGSGISWDAFLRELNAALTPRHEAPAEPWYGDRDPQEVDQAYGSYDGTSCELCKRERVMVGGATGRRICEKCGLYQEAPAEGAGEARDKLIEVLKRMDDGVYASLNDQADAVISALILQPKDPAQVGAEVASAARALLDACYKADENSDLSDFVDGMLLTRLDKALRARSSAPEAREGEAVAWVGSEELSLIRGGYQTVTATLWGKKISGTEPLYTHPAVPSAYMKRPKPEPQSDTSAPTGGAGG